MTDNCRICGNELTEEEKIYDPKDICVDCFWKSVKSIKTKQLRTNAVGR